MDNQHRKIKTYGELDQGAIGSINSFKDVQSDVLEKIDSLLSKREAQLEYLTSPQCFGNEVEGLSLKQVKESIRSLSIAKTNIQQGIMWAIKGVSCPEE